MPWALPCLAPRLRWCFVRNGQGFGFVTFAVEGSVAAALAAAPHVIDGAELEVRRASPPRSRSRAAAVSALAGTEELVAVLIKLARVD